jgi:hypothetical protein
MLRYDKHRKPRALKLVSVMGSLAVGGRCRRFGHGRVAEGGCVGISGRVVSREVGMTLMAMVILVQRGWRL